MNIDLYISDCFADGLRPQEILEELEKEFSIKIKQETTKKGKVLYCLNYDQIESPRFHPVVDDCRGIILDKDLNVVSRPFSRFYNYGEDPNATKKFDLNTIQAFVKEDGSLMKVYWYDGEWLVGSRGTCLAQGEVPASPDLTFSELFYQTACATPEELNVIFDSCLSRQKTYLFELITPLNRVVTRYSGSHIVLLGARGNLDGEYETYDELVQTMQSLWKARASRNFKLVRRFDVKTFEEILENIQDAGEDLAEGFVAVDANNNRIKFKSPQYVRAHRLRSQTGIPTLKNVVDLIVENEHHEYLSVFPEDVKFFEPIEEIIKETFKKLYETWETHHKAETQKEFALGVLDCPLSGILFAARRDGKHPKEIDSKEYLKKYLLSLDISMSSYL